jgi:Tol biopolymer transport system component
MAEPGKPKSRFPKRRFAMTNGIQNNSNTETPLESWKEIAAYLQRDVSTVIRWEKHERLPVHRHHHLSRSSVYAYPSELDAWRAQRTPAQEIRPLWQRPLPSAALALVLLLALASVGSGPYIGTMAQAADGSGLTVRQVWAGSGVDTTGGLSPDGRYLSFTDQDTDDLAVRDLTTGKNRHLTNKGSGEDSDEFADYSVVSPDGKQVAYSWYNKDGVYQLHIVRLDGSGWRVLLRGEKKDWLMPLDWSPDGSQILVGFVRNAFAEEPSVSEFAFLSLKDGSMQVVKSHTLPDGSESWMWGPRQSPDGRYVVYTGAATEGSESRDIFLLSVDGGRGSPLVQHPAEDSNPVWTPDGKKVVFASDRTGAMGFWSIDVADGKPQGLPKLVKADIGQFDRTIGLTSNGSLYYALKTGMQDVYIAEFDPAAVRIEGTPKRLASRYVGANMWPAWSPDGKYLAYNRQRGGEVFGPGSLVIVIRSVETGEEREISTGLRQLHPVHWFPDGRSLLVASFRDNSRKRVDYYRIDVRTGEASLIRRGKSGDPSRPEYGALRPDLSPDGKTIFFSQRERVGSYIVSTSFLAYHIETGQEKEIARGPEPGLGERKFVGSVFVSPDGRQLAFAEVDWKTGSSTVKVMPVSGGEAREVLKVELPERICGPCRLAWTPDGRHLLVPILPRLTGDPVVGMTELLRVPVTGGDAQKVGLAMERIGLGGVHPDGRRIVFDSGHRKESVWEVWVMENFLPEPPTVD